MKVSVIIPNYNNACFLPECLDSVLSQTYQNFEIIIIDDGSQDGSHEILINYQSLHPEKIRYYWHPERKNKGVSSTLNLAIEKSTGEYIARIDSDDIWYPEKLQQQVPILDNHPEIDIVYSCSEFIDRSGKELPGLEGKNITNSENPLASMLISFVTPQNTVVFRRKVFDQVGLFDESLIYSDWDLMVRIFSHYKAFFIDKPLAKYRIHDQTLSKGIDPQINLARIVAVFHSLEQKSTEVGGKLLEPRNQALLNLQLAFHIFCEGKEEEAINYINQAFQKDPSLKGDVEFFNFWLNQWKPDFYTIHHQHFGFWVIAHLPPTISPAFRSQLVEMQLGDPKTKDFFVRRGIQRNMAQSEQVDMMDIFEDCPDVISLPASWKKGILGEIYPTLLFASYKTGDLRKTQYYWKKTIELDPYWLRNRGIWSIGLKSLLGRRMRPTIDNSERYDRAKS